MTPEEIFNKVQEIVVEEFGKNAEDITMETSFADDLEADSVDLVEVVMNIEDEFGIEASEEELSAIKTVGDTVNFIQNKLDA
jgi:acyl carrier protein